MGVYDNIGIEKFPKQGTHAGKNVSVCFNYDSSKKLSGLVVRDDIEARTFRGNESPGITIIKLEDGRFVLSTECQYSIEKGKPFSSVVPDSIDDPQSLAYDMANAPYSFQHIPNNGYLWYELRCDEEWIDYQLAEWTRRYDEDEALLKILEQRHGATNTVGKVMPDGSFRPIGFELPEGTLRSNEFKQQQAEDRAKRRPRVWEYHTETDTYRHSTGETVKILEYKKPRLTVAAGRQIHAELCAVFEREESVGMRQFPEWLMCMLGVNALYKKQGTDLLLPKAVMYSKRVFFGVPQVHADRVDTPTTFAAVNYSTVLMAQEQEQMRGEKVSEETDRG